MKNPWLIFVMARIGIFAVILAVLLLLNVNPVFAAMIAAVVGLAVSLIFFGRQRDAVSKSVYQMVNRDKNQPNADNVEDAD